MKKIRESLLSLLLICAILTGTVFISSVSVSAVSPQLNLVRGTNCFNVVWNKVTNAAKYRLYFGANCKWRRYTDLNLNEVTEYPKNTKSVQFLVNHSSLTGRSWKPYGEDSNISTPNLTTTESYCCQVEAFDKSNKHLAWTNVGYVYLGTATVSALSREKGVGVSWNLCKGSNAYQVAYKYEGQSSYSYAICSASETKYYVNDAKPLAKYFFQVRPCVKVKDSIVAYGPWSKTVEINGYYKWKQDNWSFSNTGFGSTYSVNDTVWNKFKKDYNLTKTEITVMKKAMAKEWGGSCYGMTVSGIMVKQNQLDLSKYGGYAAIHKNSMSDNMRSLINCFQKSYGIPSVQQAIRANKYHPTTQKDILVQLEKKLKEDKKPVDVEYAINIKGNLGGHSVLAYGVESYSYKNKYDKRILIADPNFLALDKVCDEACIYYNSSNYSWIIPYWNNQTCKCYCSNGSKSDSPTGEIYLLTQYDKSIVPQNILQDSQQDHYIAGINVDDGTQNEVNIQKVNNTDNNAPEPFSSITDLDSNDSDDVIRYYTSKSDTETENTEKNYAMWDSDAVYRLSYDNPTNYNLSMDYEKIMYFGDFENGMNTEFDPDGSIDFTGNNSTYDIQMVLDDEKCINDWYSVSVAGKDTNRLSLTQSKQGYILRSDNLKNISVSVLAGEEKESAVTFSTKYDSVLIYETDENTIGLKADADGNGTFETKLVCS